MAAAGPAIRSRTTSLDPLEPLADDRDALDRRSVVTGLHPGRLELRDPRMVEVVAGNLPAGEVVLDDRAVLPGAGDGALEGRLVPVVEIHAGVGGALEGDGRRLGGADHLLEDRLAHCVVRLQLDDLDLGGDAAHLLEGGDRDAPDLDLEALGDERVEGRRGGESGWHGWGSCSLVSGRVGWRPGDSL